MSCQQNSDKKRKARYLNVFVFVFNLQIIITCHYKVKHAKSTSQQLAQVGSFI